MMGLLPSTPMITAAPPTSAGSSIRCGASPLILSRSAAKPSAARRTAGSAAASVKTKAGCEPIIKPNEPSEGFPQTVAGASQAWLYEAGTSATTSARSQGLILTMKWREGVLREAVSYDDDQGYWHNLLYPT